MNPLSYLEILKLAAPETFLSVAALAVLFVDLIVMRGEPAAYRRVIATAVAVVGGFVALCWLLRVPAQASIFGGMLAVDGVTQWVKAVVVVLTLSTCVLSMEEAFTEHVGEFYSLMLLATVGMMFLVSSQDLLMVFVSLELTSISLYALTAFSKGSRASTEAALKYFLFGSVAAAFALFGMSLVYGVAGATGFAEIAANLRGKGLDPLLTLAVVMVFAGFGFKIAAVPFHLWAPDAYEGAPTPAAALIASGSKVASFYVFAKLLAVGFAGLEGAAGWGKFVAGWAPLLATLAAFSMLLGNLAAIAQGNVRRLLAYSAVAHAGYVLVGMLALSESTGRRDAFNAVIYYVATYGLATVGAFGVVAVVQRRTGGASLEDFVGLSRRAPGLALCLMIFVLSLAGIPPLAGFFGKFYLFTAAAGVGGKVGMMWLIIFALAMSSVSLYYYLQWLKRAYVSPAPEGMEPWDLTVAERLVLAVLALAVLILGTLPDLLVGRLDGAAKLAGF